MALASDLMGLGMPAALANRAGYNAAVSTNGTGTAQTGATALGGSFSLLNPVAGNTAYVFTASAPLAKLHFLCNPTAVAALVFPPSGGTINGGTANASFTVPANSMVVATQALAGAWFVK